MIENQGKIVKACSALYLKRTIRPRVGEAAQGTQTFRMTPSMQQARR